MDHLKKIDCKPYTTTVRANIGDDSTVIYTPLQIQTAYGLNSIVTPSGKPRGYGVKIAIIVSYHYSNLQSDLNKYCKQYNLTPITLNIINQAGRNTNNNWSLESCLNTQMINTVAPGATVYVIESKDNYYSNIKTAVLTAVNLGVNIILMSFGSAEFATQSSLEYMFMNSGIIFLASSGDYGFVSYPSSSANVISVGGTTLTLNTDNTRLSETTWSDAGAGTSLYTSKPSYQNGVNTGTKINTPDVCLIADTTKGFSVYSSVNGGFFRVGGTSVSCPLLAGILATGMQLRIAERKPLATSISTSSLCIQRWLYQTIYTNPSKYSNCMYDITSGVSGVSGSLHASNGYDIASGIGSIKANTFCSEINNL